MAPIKFEENIKEKLEQRRLQPSTEAWSKLSSRLDADQKKNKSPYYWWFGIAASVVALVFVSIIYFNDDISESNALPEIVEEELSNDPAESNTEILMPQEDNEVAVEEVESIEEVNEIETPSKEEPKAVKKKSQFKPLNINELKTEEAIANTSTEKEIAKDENDKQPVKKSPEMIQVDKVVAQINAIKNKNNNTVSDYQVDSLLKVAHKELLKERIFKEGTNVVDADALLQDVEEDLGQSFRSKVYEALKSGYSKVKTAVAERNN